MSIPKEIKASGGVFIPRVMLKEELKAVRDNPRALSGQRETARLELERRARIEWSASTERLNRRERAR